MQLQSTLRGQRIKTALALIGLAVVLYLFRSAAAQVGILILGAAILAFFAKPLSDAFEKKLSRPLAALAGLLSIGAMIAAIVWLVLPVMIREASELMGLLPRSIAMVSDAFDRFAGWVSAHIKGVSLPGSVLDGAGQAISGFATETIAFAGSVADIAGRVSLMVVLGYFFLCDRDDLLLRVELLIPRKQRATAVRMGRAVMREMRMYLRGQITVALSVAALATIGLLILRVRSALALGPIIGLLNMIPYFGPFIGGVPAVLVALADSWQKAGLTILMIVIVQQLDNSLISPRVMGNLTGMSPALVLISIFTGAQISGVVGMLFALPVIMTFRTLFRVFVQRHENI